MLWFLRVLVWPFALAVDGILLGILGLFVLYGWIAPGLPSREALASVQLQQPLRIYTADGLLIGEFGAERREPIKFSDTPPILLKAFLAAEDSRFFEHPGVDVQGLARAALTLWQTGEPRQGGSTITMQVARNFFLSPEKTFKRKLTELFLALRIETELTKEQIFELYENKIFFGHRAYGVSAASRLYYNKDVHNLSLAQTAMLAGIPQAPSLNNPITRPKRALARRDYVLGRMRALGYIDEVTYQDALAIPDNAVLTGPRIEFDAPDVAELARRELFERYGDSAYTSGYRTTTTVNAPLQRLARQAMAVALFEYDARHGYRGPEAKYKGVSRMDPAALDELLDAHPPVDTLVAGLVTRIKGERATLYLGDDREVELTPAGVRWARANLGGPNRLGGTPRRLGDVVAVGDMVRVQQEEGTWRLAQLPAIEGALAAIAPNDGAVKALVGGFDYARSQFNRAVDARRQPGSSFKPFVYAAGLEKGWTPASLLDDSPLELPDGPGRVWRPKNFDGKTLGPIRLRKALVQSRNLASVDLLRHIGLDYAVKFVTRFGFSPDQVPHGMSLVLGTASASPLQMAGAYARFANGGFRVDPYLIERIEDPFGSTLFQAAAPVACADCFFPTGQPEGDAAVYALGRPQAERVIDPRIAYQMHSLMSDVIREGTAKRAKEMGREDLAGKTGTTNDSRDSWFCGYQKSLVVVSWMGFDDNSPLGVKETGGSAALTMWMEFMKVALANEPQVLPKEPPGLAHVLVNKRTGTLTHADDPEAMMELVAQEYEIMLLGPDPLPTADDHAPNNPARPTKTAKELPNRADGLF